MKKIGILLVIILVIEGIKIAIVKQYSQLIPQPLLMMYLDKPLSYEKMQEKEIYEKDELGVAHCKWGEIEGITSKRVYLVGSNSAYDNYEKLKFIEGGFFREDSVKCGSNLAVLSDQEAVALFGSTHAVGNTCKIQGVSYIVVGVYEALPIDMSLLMDDGKERVFVPITSSAMDQEGIDQVYCYLKDADTKSDLFSYYEINEQQVRCYESGEISKQLTSWGKISLIILSLYFFKKAISKSWNKDKMALVYWLVGSLGMMISMKDFYILPEALPSSNLLSFQAYLTYFWKLHQKFNALRAEGDHLWLSIYEQIRGMLLLLGSIQIILMYRMKKVSIKK